MAGPCAAILLKDRLTPTCSSRIREEIGMISDTVDGNDFWIHREPFLLLLGPEQWEMSEYPSSGLPEKLGWLPEDVLAFCAGSDTAASHCILAELCLRFALLFDGIIDFDGLLLPLDDTQLSRDLTTIWQGHEKDYDEVARLYQQLLAGFPGHAWTYRYVLDEGHRGIGLCGDAEFLQAWIKSPCFHMVK